MKAFQNPFNPRSKPLPRNLAERFLHLFDAHNVHRSQIPRLIRQIKPADLQSEARLLDALTVEVIDTTAQLFGIRSQWLEGLDDMPYQVAWSRGNPKTLLTLLADAIAAKGKDHNHFPLRVLTTSMNLDRQGHHQQWLLPVIVETVDELGDTPIHRCHIFGNHYDWTNEAARFELKALALVVYKQLGSPVSLYQVTSKEMEQFMMGQAIPSVLWRKGLLSEPCLEDFALGKQESMKAKETEELPAVLDYLDAQGLRDFTFEIPPSTAVVPSEEVAPQESPSAISEAPEKKKPAGKRDIARAQWNEVRTNAKDLWAANPKLSITGMARMLLTVPDLRLPSHREDTIRKRIADRCPGPDAHKPGRRSKN